MWMGGRNDVMTDARTSRFDLKDVPLTNVDLMLCVDELSLGTLELLWFYRIVERESGNLIHPFMCVKQRFLHELERAVQQKTRKCLTGQSEWIDEIWNGF